jgi:hypothetical protein
VVAAVQRRDRRRGRLLLFGEESLYRLSREVDGVVGQGGKERLVNYEVLLRHLKSLRYEGGYDHMLLDKEYFLLLRDALKGFHLKNILNLLMAELW